MRLREDKPHDPTDEILELPLMPLREVIMAPYAIMPLFVGRESSILAVEGAVNEHGKKLCLAVQREPDLEKPEPKDLFEIGVVSRVLQFLRLPEGTIKVLLEGLYRVRWEGVAPNSTEPFGADKYARVYVKPVPPIVALPAQSEALVRATHTILDEYVKSNRKIAPEALAALSGMRDPGRLADGILPHLKVDYREKQQALEILHPVERLEKIYELINNEITIVSMERRIKSRVKNQMERNNREYYLSEQIKAIHKEMGQEDDPQLELTELDKRLEAKLMPAEAKEKAKRELKKLRQMPPAAAEYSVIRNYLDWILDLPWQEVKETSLDIAQARQILADDHFGLDKPKERILEYLAVQKLSGSLKGPILCLVGPPGVGKTSLAKSVARATGRDYVRLSLGGVRDEAEIRGHRRTYVGAMPGKIIMSLKRAKSNNPLFCLDEIDKMSTDFKGDPASALLEVLDPEQNVAFSDHYLDLDYDLSQIFFITTANSLHTIPLPLQDRMEIIELSSYLENEKTHIARDFLLPRQIKDHGLQPEQVQVSKDALLEIIRSYTKEAGVRNLNRELAALCRKIAIKLVEKKSTAKVKIGKQNLASYLGVKKYIHRPNETAPRIGVVNGLAYTGVGGVLLNVEVAIMPGKGTVVTTGKIGEVMAESAKAALSYVRSRATALGLKKDFHDHMDIHIHFPEGATPKDGPSAGIAIATALVSALLNQPVRHDLAMTGEITLRGRVLPIGGLREKLLAASRAGVKTVFLPRENLKDLKEVPTEILHTLEIVPVQHIDEVLPRALSLTELELFSAADIVPFATSLQQREVTQ